MCELSCPSNSVPQSIVDKYLEKNPAIQEAAAKRFDESFPTSYNELANEKADWLSISFFDSAPVLCATCEADLASEISLEGCPSGLW